MSETVAAALAPARLSAAHMLGCATLNQRFEWTERDYLLYAVALGIGSEPMDGAALRFVYEQNLRVVPTFPTVIAWLLEPSFARLGAAPEHTLHAGQKIEIHRLLSAPETVYVSGGVVAVHDKGAGRGALIVMRHEIAAADGAHLSTLTTSGYARNSGGCGSGGEPASAIVSMPDRVPDQTISYAVRPDASLLYRLTGDRNPLHADPVVAAKAGFDLPILHGLCTFGLTCRAVLETTDWQSDRIASHEARFSAPVYPGETLEIDLWLDAEILSFEARVPARQTKVLSGGRTRLWFK